MVQQAVNLALNIKNLLYDNWTLEDQLEAESINWYSFEPTRNEIRNKPLSIVVTFQSGIGTTTSKAVEQMQDQHKIDVYMALRNLEGDDPRLQAEANRMKIKDEILRIIHDNQVATSGIKFNKYTRSARNDETESTDEAWYLHEILFIQAEWYHTES